MNSIENNAQLISSWISAILVWPIVIALMIISIAYLLTIGLVSIMAKAIYLYTIKDQEEVK